MKTRCIIVALFLCLSTAWRANAQRQLIPDFAAVQYAGSIGYFSAGAGYDIFKARGRASLHFGAVPKSEGGPLTILAAKLLYEPFVIPLHTRMKINPLDFGIMLSYHFGDDFKLSVPAYFGGSDNYYWWHTALRTHLVTETSVTVAFKQERFFREMTGYIECNTNDLYLVSLVQNTSTLRLNDIIKIGIGVRLMF